MRYSSQREVVLKIVRSTDCHPDAEWVYFKAKELMPKISLATVYRNLNELVSLGLVSTLETEDRKVHYDGRKEQHTHFICTECGKVIDVFSDPPCDAGDGLSVERKKIVLYGKCRDCNKNNQKGEKK